jgi:hypothetical protein
MFLTNTFQNAKVGLEIAAKTSFTSSAATTCHGYVDMVRECGIMLTRVFVERFIAPVVFTIVLIALAEVVIQIRFAPSFWDRTSWLMHDPYRGGELFDRVVSYEKLAYLLTPVDKITVIKKLEYQY